MRGQIDAVLASGTSCSVVGFKDYETVSKQFNIPVVVSGFEPLEVLESLYKSILQLRTGAASLKSLSWISLVAPEIQNSSHL